MISRKRNSKLTTARHCVTESLETRCVLSASAFGLGNTAAVTLSFAPDGTQVIDQQSDLFAKFDSVADRATWQQAILDAFQTWAIQTNADVGLVTDLGDPFGSEGSDQADSRFGDVRIGAISMGPGVMALSIPQDVVSGTWVGDVIFNTDAKFASVDEIFAVAMHEAGNVFGLEDNDNADSPMFSGGTVPPSTTPTANDIAELRRLFGSRDMDRNESEQSNDNVDDATRLKTSSSNGFDGTTPTVAYGDVSSSSDVDIYRLDPVDDNEGPMTIQVRSLGISQLEPRLQVFNRDGELVASATSSDRGGDVVDLQISSADENRYYLHVDSMTSGVGAVGGYSVSATFDELLVSSIESVEAATGGGKFRFMEQDQIQVYLHAELSGIPLALHDDGGLDDNPLTPTDLQTVPGFAEDTRYQSFGSLTRQTDVDHFALRSPDATLPFATVRLSAVGAGSLSADLHMVDRDNVPVEGKVLVNDGHDLVIQYPVGRARSSLGLRVAPRNFSGLQNYELNVSFDAESVSLNTIGSGSLTPNGAVALHAMTIEQHQLTHFVVGSTSADSAGMIAVSFRLRGNDGDIVSFEVPANEIRTGESVLLTPGNYVVEVLATVASGNMDYTVEAVEISDPLVALPDDPTDEPPASDCPGLPPELCDPLPGDATGDGVVSFNDFLVVSRNYGRTNVGWSEGDFNRDHQVSFADFLILSRNFGL